MNLTSLHGATAAVLLGLALHSCPAAHAQDNGEKRLPLRPLLEALDAPVPGLGLQVLNLLAELGPDATPAVSRLIQLLDSDNEDYCLRSALALGQIGKAAVPALVEALGHRQPNVRFYAAWALGDMGKVALPAVKPLLRALKDRDEDVRYKTAYALGRIGADDSRVAPALIDALQDEDEAVRAAASDALIGFGQVAVKPLIAALAHRQAKVRLYVAQVLGELQPPPVEAIPVLSKLLDAAEPELVREAALRLGKIGKASLSRLRPCLDSPRAEVRQAAVLGLAEIGSEAGPLLIEALRSRHVDVRRAAALELGGMQTNEKETALALARALEDEDQEVRYHALLSLSEFDPTVRPAHPTLIKALLSLDRSVRHYTYWQLCNRDQRFASNLEDSLKSRDPLTRIRCAELLLWENQFYPTCLQILTEGLKEQIPRIRYEAAEILAGVHDAACLKSIPVLEEMLKHQKVEVRTEGLAAVVSMICWRQIEGDPPPPGQKKGIELLTAASQDTDNSIRLQAAEALARCVAAARQVIPVLQALLKDKNASVRLQAVSSLEQLGVGFKSLMPVVKELVHDSAMEKEVIQYLSFSVQMQHCEPALLEALEDRSPTVRRVAAEVFGNWYLPRPVLDQTFYLPHHPLNARAKKEWSSHQKERSSLYAYQRVSFDAKEKKQLLSLLEKLALTDEDKGVRQAAVRSLVLIDQPVIPQLEHLLPSAEPQKVQFLRPAVAHLVQLLRSPDPKVRELALELVTDRRRQPVLAVPGLIVLLKGDSAEVRRTAALALEGIGWQAREALPALRAALKDNDPEVRKQVQRAIGQIAPGGAP